MFTARNIPIFGIKRPIKHSDQYLISITQIGPPEFICTSIFPEKMSNAVVFAIQMSLTTFEIENFLSFNLRFFLRSAQIQSPFPSQNDDKKWHE